MEGKQHPMCMKIRQLKLDNRNKIHELHELILSTYPNKLTSDEWLSVVNELEDRTNWQAHLEWNFWASYLNADYFIPEEVSLTLKEYVYNFYA